MITQDHDNTTSL